MAEQTISSIQEALGDVIKSIKVDNGYSTQFEDENVVLNVADPEPNLSGDESIDLYPRACIKLFGEGYEYFPTGRIHKESIWYVALSILALKDELDSLDEKVQSAINDMETAMAANYTLGGRAIAAQLVDSVYDQGYNDIGIGIVLFRIRVVYIAKHR